MIEGNRVTFFTASAGRLDRLAGVGTAESIRAALGISFRHASAGGEWPHTAAPGADEPSLLRLAAQLDARS